MKYILILILGMLTFSAIGQKKTINLNKAIDVQVEVNETAEGVLIDESYIYFFADGTYVIHVIPTSDLEVLKKSQSTEWGNIVSKKATIVEQKAQLLEAIARLDKENTMLTKKGNKLKEAWKGEDVPE